MIADFSLNNPSVLNPVACDEGALPLGSILNFCLTQFRYSLVRENIRFFNSI